MAPQVVVKYGINHITQLIEEGKAQCVVIAHDVDPIELGEREGGGGCAGCSRDACVFGRCRAPMLPPAA